MISVYAYRSFLFYFLPVQSLLTCFRSFLTHFADFVSNNSETLRLFYVSLHSRAPQQQYTVHCMHYGITLCAYLSEPFLKRQSQTSKFDRKATCNTELFKSLDHTLPLCMCYREILHVKKMADLVAVT